jgi:hypothetical protein
VLSHTNVEKLSEGEVKHIQQSIYRFCSEFLRRWKSSNGIEKHFIENNAQWLDRDFVLLPKVLANFSENLASTSFVIQIFFEQGCEKSKRRKGQQLRKEHEAEALT